MIELKKSIFMSLAFLSFNLVGNAQTVFVSSLDAVNELSVTRFQEGVIRQMIQSNLSRWASYATILNFSSDKKFSIKIGVHPEEKKGLNLSVWLLPAKDYEIPDLEIFRVVDSILLEVNNTLSYFAMRMGAESFSGEITEKFHDGKNGRVFDFGKIAVQLETRARQEALARAYLSMAVEDQKIREAASFDKDASVRLRVQLKSLIENYGWPTIAQVGDQVSHLVWMMILNTDYDLGFQKSALEILKKLPAGSVEKSEICFLEDRILVNEGKGQKYGTQFRIDEKNNIVPYPIDDFPGLEKRRKESGLEPFKDYLESVHKLHSSKK